MRSLFANDEVQANAANFDEVAIIQTGWTADGHAVDKRYLVARADVVAVVALVDLRSHLRLEEAAKLDGGHGGLADGSQPVGEDVFLKVSFAGKNDDGGY